MEHCRRQGRRGGWCPHAQAVKGPLGLPAGQGMSMCWSWGTFRAQAKWENIKWYSKVEPNFNFSIFIINYVNYLKLPKVRCRLQNKQLLVWGAFIYWNIGASLGSNSTRKWCYYRTKLKVLNATEICKSEQHSRLDTSDSWVLSCFWYCGTHRNIYFHEW